MSEMINEANNQISFKENLSDLFIFVSCFIVLLTVALLGQLIGIHWKTWLSGSEGSQNIFMGIKAAVYTFMSNIN
jgi:hypothetical protein